MRLAKSGRVLVRGRWSGCRGTLVRAEGSSVGGHGSERGELGRCQRASESLKQSDDLADPRDQRPGYVLVLRRAWCLRGIWWADSKKYGLGSEGRLLRFALACLNELRSPGRCTQKPLTDLLSFNRFSVPAHHIGRRASDQPWVQLSPGILGRGRGNKDVLFLPAS